MILDALPSCLLVEVRPGAFEIYWGIKDDSYYQKTFFVKEGGSITREALEVIINNSDFRMSEMQVISEIAGLSEADSVLFLKNMLERLIKAHDKSDEVNTFSINGNNMWLDKNTRLGLRCRLQSERDMGIPETTLWDGNLCYSMSTYKAEQLLNSLEVYSSKCYDTTKRHLCNIEQLKTIQEIVDYNYKASYPEKVNIKLED